MAVEIQNPIVIHFVTVWELYDQLKNSGCTFVGAVSADGYSYSSSIAIIDGKFVGLALDDVNESGKTEERINSWVEEIKKNL